MNLWEYSLLMGGGSFFAGLLGALTGLGGGVVIVPFLTLALGVDLRYAIGASLISVIATSSGSAAAYVREGYSNIRLGMFLEIATTLGAIAGAFVALRAPTHQIAIVFGIVLLYSAYQSIRPQAAVAKNAVCVDSISRQLRLNGAFPAPGGGWQCYQVSQVPGGFSLMFGAGVLSGLLGIGSGAIKVLAMDRVMGLPFKVSTTTSNFMIGVTAAASAGVYLSRGYFAPGLVMPVLLGVLAGSSLGTRLLLRAPVHILRTIFGVVIFALALEMLYNGATGRI